jgi:hypothetical protein
MSHDDGACSYRAFDLDIGAARVAQDGTVQLGDRHASGIEFSLWRIDDQTIAFLAEVPSAWPIVSELRAHGVIALVRAETSIEGRHQLFATTNNTEMTPSVLAAATAAGAMGFAIVDGGEKNLLVSLSELGDYTVAVKYGNPDAGEAWTISVGPSLL